LKEGYEKGKKRREGRCKELLYYLKQKKNDYGI
jgi:hypothetical protein